MILSNCVLCNAPIPSYRRFLVGQNPLNVDAIWERIRVSGIFTSAQGGQFTTALSGLEIALLDLAGQALGLPVYQLLGGKFRDKVRIYCDSDMDSPVGPESDKKLPWIRDQGFTAMKIDLDEAADPNRFDKVNWTADNAEIDRMVSWVKLLPPDGGPPCAMVPVCPDTASSEARVGHWILSDLARHRTGARLAQLPRHRRALNRKV